MANLFDRIMIRKNIPLIKKTNKRLFVRVICIRSFAPEKETLYHKSYKGSVSSVPEEIENLYRSKWDGNSSCCTHNNAVRMARISAPLKHCTYFQIVHPRDHHLLSINCVDARTKSLNHPLGKFHQISFAMSGCNYWKSGVKSISYTCVTRHH